MTLSFLSGQRLKKLAYDALDWAFEGLSAECGSTIFCCDVVVETPYSHVWRINNVNQDFYLKQVPPGLYGEVAMLEYLAQQKIQHVPELIASDNLLHCLLMPACGDVNLRNLYEHAGYCGYLQQGVGNYADIQRQLERNIDALLELGLSDWRLSALPSLYAELVDSDALLIADGLTGVEILRLQDQLCEFKRRCQQLASFGIEETVCHADFHDNNLLLDSTTKHVSIIDWGECVIAHPFFSFASCLWALSHFHQLSSCDVLHHLVVQTYLSRWCECFEIKVLTQALDCAQRLLGVFAALAYQRMYETTDHLQHGVRQSNPGSIAGCLRSYLFLA